MHIIALNRCWVIYWRWLLVTIVVVALLLGLAMWQWARAANKAQLLQRLEQLQQAGAVSARALTELTPAQADGLLIGAQAHWVAPVVWLLDNQMLQGKIGYDLIVPMQLDATGEIVLINLGWLAAPRERAQLPVPSVPARFTIQGVVRTHLGGFRLGKNTENNGRWPRRIQQIDLPDLSAQLKQSLYAGIIYQQQNSPYAVHYQPVVMLPERHRAYALQWALLAIAVLVIALAASAKKIETSAIGASAKELL
jgi:surfeit locus 1 family protein